MGHECVLHSVTEAFRDIPVSHAVIAWVFTEQTRVEEGPEKLTAHFVGKSSAKPASVSFRTLPKAGVVILCLRQACIKRGDAEGHGLERVLHEQLELFAGVKGTQHRTGLAVRRVHRLDVRLAGDVY